MYGYNRDNVGCCCFSKFQLENMSIITYLSNKPHDMLQFKSQTQRYHCKYNFTAASIILPPRDLFYCREIYFTAASFILLPRVLFYCREFCFTATTFVLPPRVLFCRREFYFHHREFNFTASGENKTRGGENKTRGGKINLAAV